MAEIDHMSRFYDTYWLNSETLALYVISLSLSLCPYLPIYLSYFSLSTSPSLPLIMSLNLPRPSSWLRCIMILTFLPPYRPMHSL